MTATLSTQIDIDAKGVARIAGTGYKIKVLIPEILDSGCDAQAVREQHPDLSIAQIYAALTYYHENKDEVDAQIEEGLRIAEEFAASQPASDPFLQRMRVHKQQQSQ